VMMIMMVLKTNMLMIRSTTLLQLEGKK